MVQGQLLAVYFVGAAVRLSTSLAHFLQTKSTGRIGEIQPVPSQKAVTPDCCYDF
jgi:hypothetical protein